VDIPAAFMLESWPMRRWYGFFGFFFFPCLLAEGTD
jgi:hypothetical protein